MPDLQFTALIAEAEKCRRLAISVKDPRTVEVLLDMATKYQERAQRLLALGDPNP